MLVKGCNLCSEFSMQVIGESLFYIDRANVSTLLLCKFPIKAEGSY